MSWDDYARRYRQTERDPEIPPLLRTALSANTGEILDVGCGEGDLLDKIRNAYLNWTVAGFEISAFRAEIARQPGHAVTCDPSGALPIKKYDLAVSSHVVEHVVDDEQHVLSLANIVRTRGLLYIETPLKLRGGWYFRRSSQGQWVLDPTHVREYHSPERLTSLLELAGFHVSAMDIRPLSFPMSALRPLVRRSLGLGSDLKSVGGRNRLRVPIPRYRILSVLAMKL